MHILEDHLIPWLHGVHLIKLDQEMMWSMLPVPAKSRTPIELIPPSLFLSTESFRIIHTLKYVKRSLLPQYHQP